MHDTDEIFDAETAYLIANESASDPAQPYHSPFARARAGALRTIPEASTGAGDLTSTGTGLVGRGPAIDRGTLRVPDSVLANIVRGVDEIRASGDLHLAAEIERALIEVGGGEFTIPEVAKGDGFAFDWRAFDPAHAGFGSVDVDRAGFVTDDGAKDPKSEVTWKDGAIGEPKSGPSPEDTGGGNDNEAYSAFLKNTIGGGGGLPPAPPDESSNDQMREARQTSATDSTRNPNPNRPFLGDDSSGPSGAGALLAQMVARSPGLRHLLGQGAPSFSLRGGTAGGLDFGPNGQVLPSASATGVAALRRGWADEPNSSPVLDASATLRRFRYKPGGGGAPPRM